MKFFYKDMELDVPESVYCPKEDSELLASVIENMDIKGKHVLEVGCGCGFLSILMAKNKADVTAVDINPEAVEATKTNAKKNNAGLTAMISDMFGNVNDKFDLIVFNPPYLPVGEDENDITYSGGSTGREIIEIFVSCIRNYLKKGGKVLTVISSLTGEKEVLELFGQARMRAKPVARKKIPWEQLIVIMAE